MLLGEDPAMLISCTVKNFNIDPDKLAVSRIDESLSTLEQARDLRVREAESSLRRLARRLDALASRHDELVASHRAGAATASTDSDRPSSSLISRLDTDKFRTAKAASDAEAEAERLALQAADLAARLQELELQGPDAIVGGGGGGGGGGGSGSGSGGARDAVDDEVLLRLKIYRSLGIDVERDDKDGAWVRAVIRNDRKGDVHVVNMDKKFSRFFYANYFWKTL